MFHRSHSSHWSNLCNTERGFTLIELIVVMALLSVVLAIAAPRLGGFLSGRNVQEEARRMLSITRYARAEAISRGEPMQVWFDVNKNMYGVRSAYSEALAGTDPVQFACREGISLGVDAQKIGKDGQATILFQPDGGADADSVDRVEIREDGVASLALAQLDTGADYEVEDARNAQTATR